MSPVKLNLTSSAPIAAPIAALSYNRINSVVFPFLGLVEFQALAPHPCPSFCCLTLLLLCTMFTSLYVFTCTLQ